MKHALFIIILTTFVLAGCKTHNMPVGGFGEWPPEQAFEQIHEPRALFKSAKRKSKNRRKLKVSRKKRPQGLSKKVYAASHATISCLDGRLVTLLNRVATHYKKPVRIQSGYRSEKHNRRVGGAKNSFHRKCQAADLIIAGVNKYRLARYLKSLPGRSGVGTYCASSSVHLDVGRAPVSWHWGCRKKRRKKRRRLNRRRMHAIGARVVNPAPSESDK